MASKISYVKFSANIDEPDTTVSFTLLDDRAAALEFAKLTAAATTGVTLVDLTTGEHYRVAQVSLEKAPDA